LPQFILPVQENRQLKTSSGFSGTLKTEARRAAFNCPHELKTSTDEMLYTN